MTPQVVDLRHEGTWDVPRLLAADVLLLWNEIEVRRLGEVAEIFGLQPVQMFRPVEADGGACAADFEYWRARRPD